MKSSFSLKVSSIYKVITIIILVVIFMSTFNFASADYMQGVNIEAFNQIYDKLMTYENKRIATQSFIGMDDTCKFIDYKPINKVQVEKNDFKRKNKIAITIDDSFLDTYTEEILDVLDEHNCKATFFITYKLLNANIERVYEIIDRGHEIGNHSMTHPPFKNLHTLRKEWEINTFNNWMKEFADIDICLFRFPTGSYDEEAIVLLKNLNIYPIGWSIDTRDWELRNLDKIYDMTISKDINSGDIILLHNGYKFSKELFDKLLTYYESKGFSYLKVSELLYSNDFIVEDGIQKRNKK